MKTRFFLNQLLSVIAILCCVNLSTTIAQKNKMVDKQQGITYCDEYISETKSVLEKKANTTCRTAKETIPCNDKKTGLPVHVTMVIQPTEKGCPNYVKVATSIAEEPMSRGTSKNRFSVEVIQEPCADKKGVMLNAYIPGFDATEKMKVYDFEWMTDGEVFDRDKQTDCLNKEKVTLKVTEIATGQTVIKSITTAPTNDNSRDYKVFGFEKTPCYGTCPVYKVSINKSGKATYRGIANTERQGDWETTIDGDTMKKLKEAAFKANYFELSRKYPIEGEVADASRTITYFRSGDTEMSVNHTLGGPDSLVKFEEYLEKTIANLKWTKIRSEESK